MSPIKLQWLHCSSIKSWKSPVEIKLLFVNFNVQMSTLMLMHEVGYSISSTWKLKVAVRELRCSDVSTLMLIHEVGYSISSTWKLRDELRCCTVKFNVSCQLWFLAGSEHHNYSSKSLSTFALLLSWYKSKYITLGTPHHSLSEGGEIVHKKHAILFNCNPG